MPMKKKYGCKKKKSVTYRRYRRYRRGRGRYARTRMMKVPAANVFPDRVRVKLTYTQEEELTQATFATPLEWRSIRGNGPFDPDFFIGGTQPLGWDQWVPFYNQAVVKASKITVNCANTGAGVGVFMLLLTVRSAPVSTSNGIYAQQQPYCKYKFVGSIDSGRGNVNISHYMSTAKIFGVPGKTPAIEDDYASSTSSVPINEWYWHIYTYSQSTSAFDPTFTIRVTYYVEFFDRK